MNDDTAHVEGTLEAVRAAGPDHMELRIDGVWYRTFRFGRGDMAEARKAIGQRTKVSVQ